MRTYRVNVIQKGVKGALYDSLQRKVQSQRTYPVKVTQKRCTMDSLPRRVQSHRTLCELKEW